jgi:hypothetical protein
MDKAGLDKGLLKPAPTGHQRCGAKHPKGFICTRSPHAAGQHAAHFLAPKPIFVWGAKAEQEART